jgi:hypothetical protein
MMTALRVAFPAAGKKSGKLAYFGLFSEKPPRKTQRFQAISGNSLPGRTGN